MKLIYIHEYFTTNEGTGGTRSYDVAKHLIGMDHEVTIISGLHVQSGLPPMSWWRLFATYDIDGIKVVVCNARYSNNLSVPARLWCWFKFIVLATVACMFERGSDLIFATSTPLTVGVPARIASALLRVPYVFEVRDLWPEDLLAAGRMKPGLQYSVWQWLERFCYAKAKMILLVSKGFHDRLLERGFDPARLKTILLGADGSLFENVQPNTAFFADRGLADKTIAVYTGAHGDANGLHQLIEAADLLRDRPDIAIVLIGQGKMKETLQADIDAQGLTNIHLLDPVTKLELPAILVASHIGLMILKQIERPRWVTPNKIFDYMFSGLPSIVNFAGTTADLVEAEDVGVASIPGSGKDLAENITRWADHPEERAAVGKRAREVATQKFDRFEIARQLADVFATCLRGNTSRHGG